MTSPPSAEADATAKATSAVWLRRWGPWLVVLLPAIASLAVDLSHRAGRIGRFSPEHLAYYALSLVQAAAVWGLLLHAVAAERRLVRGVAALLFVAAFTIALGSQTYFFSQYRSYINRDISVFAVEFWDSIVNQASVDLSGLLLANVPFLLLAVGLCLVAARALATRRVLSRHAAWLAPLGLLVACVTPLQDKRWQAATPDMLYLSALGRFVSGTIGVGDPEKPPPRARASRALPDLACRPSCRNNVLFIITESVRADAVCSRHEPHCKLTPYTNELLPDRVGLTQLRALDSTTATSLAVLWSGLSPTESADSLHTWPLLFDYANAAGYDTAFWTSQNLNFGNSRLWVKNLGARLFVSANALDEEADLDLGVDESKLADHIEDALDELREPFFAVVQLSNTHHPYFVDPNRPAPFQPAQQNAGPRAREQFRNFYQNAVVQQDQHVARIISAVRSVDSGERTAIIYTSDHGEAFREHHQMGHTFSIYDEEVRVPGFVDAPPPMLSEAQRAELEGRREVPVFHDDLVPTILDLMGLWDLPELLPFKSKLHGESWLRPPGPERTVAMTNCSPMWSCTFENWGVMRGNLKVHARTPYDRGWRCFDVATDPREKRPLRSPTCDQLKKEALTIFGRLPR